MRETLRLLRLFGPLHMLRMARAYRQGWTHLLRGALETRAMQTLLNVGFLDELVRSGSVECAAFARLHNLDETILRGLCEAMFSVGMFGRNGDHFFLEAKGQLLMDKFRGWLELSYGYEEVFHRLEPLLRKEIVYGTDLYRRPDFVAKGSGEMENHFYFPLANQIIIEKGFRNVLDLGCGDGTFLRRLCQLNKQVTCFGIDLAPQAIEDGKRLATQEGLLHRVNLFAADISGIQKLSGPLTRVDAATTFFVLHELMYEGEDRVIDFLKDFRRIFPRVPLIVFEPIRPTPEEARARPGVGIFYFLFHDLSHQKTVGREQWTKVFRAAGFTSIQERYLGVARTAIFQLQ
ncbi:MAG TPA: class I SAM-dependent methyltransferase [Bryobacteraceae bacterium]|jgi:SAM-dependent methyltransferase|nr:class I SAM-dependent methyltransferase [Bryobacteraceae bacterium]